METKFRAVNKRSGAEVVIELRGDEKFIASLMTCIEEFLEKRDCKIE